MNHELHSIRERQVKPRPTHAIVREAADEKFGPLGWVAASLTFVLDDGEATVIRITNTARGKQSD